MDTLKLKLPDSSKLDLLELLKDIVQKTKETNLDIEQRAHLMALQANADLEAANVLPDPPLLELEKQSFHIFLSVLMDMTTSKSGESEVLGKVADNLVEVCVGELRLIGWLHFFTNVRIFQWG